MHCPETIIACQGWAYICHHGRGDVRWECRPRAERWNPLRYEVGLRWPHRNSPVRFRVNRDGKWNIAFSNLTWKLWRKRRWESRQKQGRW